MPIADSGIEDLQARYAELVVRVGVNVQPGQEVVIRGLVEHAPVARAIARQAYLAGARRVTVEYDDLHVQHAAAELGPEDWLGRTPEHVLAGIRGWVESKPAVIRLTGNPEPQLFADLDPTRVARLDPKDQAAVRLPLLAANVVTWTVAAAPNPGWARVILGEPDLPSLWRAVAAATRLDETDPVAAWRAHVARLQTRASTLERYGFDAIRFRGAGTDLTVGLLGGCRWLGGSQTSSSGIDFVPNLPTEEVFTSPDRRRAEGTVRVSYPFVVPGSNAFVRGLQLRLAGGRVVEVTADEGAEAIREQLASEPNAAHLGEVALVDGSSRVRGTGLVFRDTLFDENAGSHIAYGQAFPGALDAAAGKNAHDLLALGLNVASLHTDMVIGGPEVNVDGLDRSGQPTPIIRDDTWVLP